MKKEKLVTRVGVTETASHYQVSLANGDIQDSIAHVNNGHFEKFRSAWPSKAEK
jgi:hypothetical protein